MTLQVLHTDPIERDDITETFDEGEIQAIKKVPRKFTRGFNNYNYGQRGFASASIQNINTVLSQAQLKQCAYVWINNGIVRQCINKLCWHLLGERTSFTVDPNDELTEFIAKEKQRQLVAEILGESKNRVEELRVKLIRVNKRCHLFDNNLKLVKNTFLFGRNFQRILRFSPNKEKSETQPYAWPRFGEPEAIAPMNSLRIQDVKVNERTLKFQGYYYDFGVNKERKQLIPSTEMIPMWNDDDNVLDMTYASGVPLVWSILSVAQAIDTMNDEDVPEYVKGLYAKLGVAYAGGPGKAIVTAFRKQLEVASIVVTGKKDANIQTVDLGGSLMDIMNGREASAKFIAWSTAIPLFIIFEDTANFATANQALQAFKAGTLDRMRRWLQDALETYWYDPILSDHFDIPIEQVIAQRIKIKAIIKDIVYDMRKDQVATEVSLVQAGIKTPEEALEALGEDELLDRRRQQQDMRDQMKQEAINEIRAKVIANGGDPNTFQQGQPNNNQQPQQDQGTGGQA